MVVDDFVSHLPDVADQILHAEGTGAPDLNAEFI